jgi:putative endonuclease
MTGRKDSILAFVEVKYRSSPRYGHVLQTVGQRKQRRIKLTASYFLSQNPTYRNHMARFDVVGIEPHLKPEEPKIIWLRNAFY